MIAKHFYPPLNKTVYFKGVVWDEHWDFDCPVIVYSPVCRYSPSGSSISEGGIEELVEDICIDLCLKGSVECDWSASDLKEFKWRGWSVNGFSRRKNAVQAIIPVTFYIDKDGRQFDMGKAKVINASRRS